MNCPDIEAIFSIDTGGTGVSDHTQLSGRDEADQHPIESVTGLSDYLTGLDDRVTTLEGNDHDLGNQVSNIQSDYLSKTSNNSQKISSSIEQISNKKSFDEALDDELVRKEQVSQAISSINNNYTLLENKPSINNITIEGETSLDTLGIQPKGEYALSETVNSQASEISSLKELKLDKQQGNENVGKTLIVGADGNVTLGEINATGDVILQTNYGIIGDYSSRYGIIDCPNGLIDFSANNKILKINAGIVLKAAGSTTKTTIGSEITYTVKETGKVTLFLAEGEIIEAGDVFYEEEEPSDGTTSYLAWYKPTLGKWQFKSNDTGNVFREAIATPIANVNANETGIVNIDYIGYRIFDDDCFASLSDVETINETLNTIIQDLNSLRDRISALETQ